MARIIQTGDTPAKRRNAHIRSAAEVLRLLATRSLSDPEAQDMAAFLAYNLRGIYQTIEESVRAWEDRNYWQKAEQLRHKWRWSHRAAETLEQHILTADWHQVQNVLITLIPHFSHVTIQAITRNADWWCGALNALRRQHVKGL